MILLGPIVGLVLGLTKIDRTVGLAITAGAAAIGALLLGLAAQHDSSELSIGFWISALVFLLAAIGFFLAARVVRERRTAR
jgi:hypothetical protein